MQWNEFLKMLSDSGVKSVTFELGGLRQSMVFGPDVDNIKVKKGDADDLKEALESRAGVSNDAARTDGFVPSRDMPASTPEPESEPKSEPKSELKAVEVDVANNVAEVTEKVVGERTPVLPTDKPLFDAFVDALAKDDGGELDVAFFIGEMTLSDLIRVNNEYTLGIDTDVPQNDLRKAIIECFQ